jgi:hypothetical protein
MGEEIARQLAEQHRRETFSRAVAVAVAVAAETDVTADEETYVRASAVVVLIPASATSPGAGCTVGSVRFL